MNCDAVCVSGLDEWCMGCGAARAQGIGTRHKGISERGGLYAQSPKLCVNPG
ncbi:MAG: hypothetical protein HOP19_24505 [Acidobacteria bacterium]|nr:hypothetical protein [Acidobacteriota bacterium]